MTVRPIAPGLTGGPGYVDNTQGQNWTPANPRPTPNTVTSTVPPTSAATSQSNAATSMASVMNVPQNSMQHSMPMMQQHAMTFPPAQSMTYPPAAPIPYTNNEQHYESMHPVADNQQNTFPHDDFWAEHLQYEPSSMGYGNAQGGVYSYYPQGFQ